MSIPRKRGRPRKHPLPPTEGGEEEIDPTREFEDLDASGEAHEDLVRLTTSPLPSAPAWLDKLHMDSRLTTLKLVAMARQYHVQLEERLIGQIMAHAGLTAERGQGYQLIPALWALLEYYKRHAEKTHKAGDPDKNRTKKAEADTAELKAMKLAGEVVPLEAAKQFWSDARIEVRKTVELATYLSKDQKKELLGDFQGLKTKLTSVGDEE